MTSESRLGAHRLVLIALAVVAGPAAAEVERPHPVTEERAPCADFDARRNPYFGDLHVHTTFSQDASTQGTRHTPRDAYRFAVGERLGIQPYAGDEPLRSLQLERPLDFAAVTDHAELLGETHACKTPGVPGHDSWVCRIYRNWPRLAFFVMNAKSSMSDPTRFGFCGEGGALCLAAARTPWQEIQSAAEGAYDRTSACRFTSFVAYEWTGSTRTNNLHRNIVFRNERVPDLPPSFFEEQTAQGLWSALQRECLDRGDGCDVLVIPHNSNLSNGLMWQLENPDGSPLTPEDARTRADIERLVEVMQHKGDSECELGAGSTDEQCGFEKLSFTNFLGKFAPFLADPADPRSFTRRVLKDGLVLEETLGANPFQFGLIASTDTHLGTPGYVREDAHPGHGGAGAPADDGLPTGLPDDLEFNPGGLAGIWAEENSRDALFEAMRRREVWGTSGPRIPVRFFGSWSDLEGICDGEAFAERGYAGGVPMGAELAQSHGAGAPTFAVWALRDPGGLQTPLQRVQIIKGWVEGGIAREAVFDVTGHPPGAATVDPSTCETSGPGSASLCGTWRDPEFDPAHPAFYYARVLENPTCRWSAHLCNQHGVDCSDEASVPDELSACCAEGHRRVIQERAWGSPIWYTPAERE